MLHKLLLPVAAVALISACSSAPPTVQTGDDAEVIARLADGQTKARFRAENPDYWVAAMDG